jgi:pimeloyl-ACP methyl ester carboxylesterase
MRETANFESQILGDRGRPAQPLDAFLRQSNAVIAHDSQSPLAAIKAPVQITFGRNDVVTSNRFSDGLKIDIAGTEMVVFEGCAHVPRKRPWSRKNRNPVMPGAFAPAPL